MRKIHTYMGCNIHPKPADSSGMRWYAFTPKGQVRGATLADIKHMIRDAVKVTP